MSVFSSAVKALMAGGFICEVSNPESFDYLSVPEQRVQIDNFLQRIDYCVRDVDEEVFYLAYINPEQDRSGVRSQFYLTRDALIPLVRFMDLVRKAMNSDESLRPKDTLRLGALLERIEDSRPLQSALEELRRTPFINSQTGDAKLQLSMVFKRLVEHGYLVQHDQFVFTATYKWAYLYSVIDFILSQEAIPVEEEEITTQGGLI